MALAGTPGSDGFEQRPSSTRMKMMLGLSAAWIEAKKAAKSRAKENFMVVLLIPLKRSKVSAQAVWDDSATRRDSESSPNGIFLL